MELNTDPIMELNTEMTLIEEIKILIRKLWN